MKKVFVVVLAAAMAAIVGVRPAELRADAFVKKADPTLIESYPSVDGDTMFFAVKNNTDGDVTLQDLTVEIRNSNGDVVATTVAKGYPEDLSAGEEGHYMVTFEGLDESDGIFSNINKVVTRKDAEETRSIELVDHTIEEGKIIGEVKNITKDTVKAEVYAICNDPETGKFSGIACKEITFKAGESVAFEMPVQDMINENGLAYRIYIRYLEVK